jgi:U3 small nucleolar RNA-associated protein 14
MASTFQPTTDMEKEIEVVCVCKGADNNKILEKSEMKEKDVRNRENQDLEHNKLSIEDVKARNEELAHMKSLLFYQEQKNKRINKIKSKKYHKIHKKAEERRKEKEREVQVQHGNQVQMLRETDPELYQELLEKDAVKRARERMTLKHKNTSKVSQPAHPHV